MSITRKRQLEIIASGESVVVGKTVYSAKNVKDLPSEADQAKGDPEKEAAARKNLEAEKAKADAELAKLSKSEEKAEAKSEAKAEHKAEAKSEAKK